MKGMMGCMSYWYIFSSLFYIRQDTLYQHWTLPSKILEHQLAETWLIGSLQFIISMFSCKSYIVDETPAMLMRACRQGSVYQHGNNYVITHAQEKCSTRHYQIVSALNGKIQVTSKKAETRCSRVIDVPAVLTRLCYEFMALAHSNNTRLAKLLYNLLNVLISL